MSSPEWRTRLAVTMTVGETEVPITPIDTFTPSFSMNVEPLHSVEASHIGAIYSPPTINFSMTVKAIGDVVGRLTKLALDGSTFDISLGESTGSDWTFDSFVLRNCLITSASPSTVTVTGAPSATFSGFSLEASLDPKTGESSTVP
jgi:hypothetical protein